MVRGARVGVVGAGIVGLSTAYALRHQGADVRVYESGVPGGLPAELRPEAELGRS